MQSKKSRRNKRFYDSGAANILETIIAIGISIALLSVFFISTNNLYKVYERNEIDLQAKSISILEQIVTSPGASSSSAANWEQDPNNITTLGLGTSPTVAYGVVYVDDEGESTVLSHYDFQGDVGFETCLLAGTKISMADGSHKNIEDVVVGDSVKSYDESDGKVVSSKVSNVFHHTPAEMTDYYIVINNQLCVTPNHRFYSDGKWVYAADLKVGNLLFTPSHNVPIYSLEKVFEKCQTYDLEIGVYHNYFVSMGETNVLVHNGPGPNPPPAYDHIIYTIIMGDSNGITYTPIELQGGFVEQWENNGTYDFSFPYSYTWDWGDGETSSGEVLDFYGMLQMYANHTYTEAGNKTVTLTVICSHSPPHQGSNSIEIEIVACAETPLPPKAKFTWFDKDGLNDGKDIVFDATESVCYQGSLTYSWWWNWTSESDPNSPNMETGIPVVENDFYTDDFPFTVRLKVNDIFGRSDNYTCIVQANAINIPDIGPEKETYDVYPQSGDETLTPYDERYYTIYTELDEAGYYIYEVKSKSNPTPRAILDYDKISNLPKSGTGYFIARSCLGLDILDYIGYNFNIKVAGSITKITYGASYEAEDFISAYNTSREVLIYHKPVFSVDNGISTLVVPPYYESGRITVSVFLGGEVPNAPPDIPCCPIPINGANDVAWNHNLYWECSDLNYDPLTYDVYFGTTSPPPQVASGQSSTTYNPPGNMLQNKKYYWNVTAKDNRGEWTAGPIWSFTTHQNNKPDAPINLNPESYEKDVCVSPTPTLGWSCNDQDISYGDNLTYNVYFGKTEPLTWVSHYQASNTYDISGIRLDYNTTYYWRIDAIDSYQESKLGQTFEFATAKKGLDQIQNKGTDYGLSTLGQYLGQTFTAGRTGNLTSIELSLANVGGLPGDKISVKIRKSPGEPVIAYGNISAFLSPGGWVWKTVNLDKLIKVTQNQQYFIEIGKTGQTNYNWQYSNYMIPTGGGEYPGGNAWKSNDGIIWVVAPPATDFLFKTYVFRDQIADQSCTTRSNTGKTIGEGLAQTFKAGDIGAEVGDLMKVRLSLKSNGVSDITVNIYVGIPGIDIDNPVATTTIKAFNSGVNFVWKQANFTDMPYLLKESTYYIEILAALPTSCEWENRNALGDYAFGVAYEAIAVPGGWGIINPRTDFIFTTYMDTIDTC